VEELAKEYSQETWQNILQGFRHKYSATWWRDSVVSHEDRNPIFGARNASVELMKRSGGVPQSGFRRLIDLGLLKTSVEYTMLKPKYRELFKGYPQELEVARFVLHQAGVTPPDEI
jgi:hypothetical protein